MIGMVWISQFWMLWEVDLMYKGQYIFTRMRITRRLWIWTQNVHIWSAALVKWKWTKIFRSRSCDLPKMWCLHIIRCEMVKRVLFKKGTPYAIYSPCYINYSNYCKMELVKPHQIMMNYIPPGSVCMADQICSQNIKLGAHMKCYSLIYIEMCCWILIQPNKSSNR